MQVKPFLKYILMLALSVVLTSLTVVFGTLPMRAVRKAYGRVPYWAGYLAVAGVLVAVGLAPYAIVVLAMVIMIGVYAEAEAHGSTVFNAGWVAILATLGLGALGGGIWLYQAKVNLGAVIRAQLAPTVEILTGMNPQISLDGIMRTLPSGVVLILMTALAFGLIWEGRMLSWFKLPSASGSTMESLLAFRVPDLTVWLVMLAILGAFLKHGNMRVETVSINALYIFAGIYFFQGLAVVAHALRTFKVSPVWQTIWYVIIAVQLLPMVSFLGFADYWLEFRQRMSRKPAETNKGF